MIFRAFVILSLVLSLPVQALSRLPTPLLADRVKQAETVFVGTLVNRVEQGDWVRAELRVDAALRNADVGAKVKVVWRKKLGNLAIYDAAEGAKGVALLGDKHEGRYWLRDDKFEPLAKQGEIKKLLAGGEPAVPTFDEWVRGGKKLPPGRMFIGGTPWFNERTGTRRSAEEVYAILYGKNKPKAGPGKKTPVPEKP